MIKQPWLLAVSGLCLVMGTYFVVDRLVFLATAERVMGTVTELTSRNDTCGSERNRYRCTKFRAEVAFEAKTGGSFTIDISAGQERGHDEPLSRALYEEGSQVEVVYSPRNPSKAYQNTLFGVWGAPIIAFGVQISTLLGSFSEGRRRRRW